MVLGTLRIVRPQYRWGRRILEWSVVLVCILAASVQLWSYAQQVRSQAERAAVLSTLGALRTALVLDYVTSKAHARETRQLPAAPNPFLLLERPLATYVGEVPAALVSELPAGSWFYDKQCLCVGYKPLQPQSLTKPEAVNALWFLVEPTSAAHQLRALQPYLWAGMLVQ